MAKGDCDSGSCPLVGRNSASFQISLLPTSVNFNRSNRALEGLLSSPTLATNASIGKGRRYFTVDCEGVCVLQA